MKKLTTEEFIQKAQQIHNQKYDYQFVNYKNAHTKVNIICPEHGIFEQKPNDHLQGKGCNQCGIISSSSNRKYNIKYFIKKAKQIHGDKYDYSLVEYKGIYSMVKIICKKHGMFGKTPDKHLHQKSGCSKCANHISKPEIEVQDFVKSLGFKIQCNNRKILNGKELDIFIPSLNKAIEFNGTYWHYHPDNFIPERHGNKSNLCRTLNISLLHLRQDLWLKNKQKMKKVIHKFLDFKN